MVSTRLGGSRHHKFCPKAPGHSNNEVNCIFKSFLHMFASIFICTGQTNLPIIKFSVNWLTVLMHTDFKEQCDILPAKLLSGISSFLITEF